ncbi:hypothetical protein IZY60_08855 [Lutibacter sp. B2]|nr:hypothetical protein [Lutibacter sp. B2]
MNFLDKVKQGMIDSTKVIKDLSSDVTEITKSKKTLAKNMDLMDQLYYDLGKKTYQCYEEKPFIEGLSDEISSLLLEMISLSEKINISILKIESLKGIFKCNQCKHEIDEAMNFCPHCGNELVPLEEEELSSNSEESVEDPPSEKCCNASEKCCGEDCKCQHEEIEESQEESRDETEKDAE